MAEQDLFNLELIAREWVDAFNAHDIERLISLYDDSARHYSPKLEQKKPATKGWLHGKEDLIEWWQECFDTLKGLNYRLVDLSFNVQRGKVFIEYVRKVEGEPDRLVMEYLRIENGFITESRVLRSFLPL